MPAHLPTGTSLTFGTGPLYNMFMVPTIQCGCLPGVGIHVLTGGIHGLQSPIAFIILTGVLTDRTIQCATHTESFMHLACTDLTAQLQ